MADRGARPLSGDRDPNHELLPRRSSQDTTGDVQRVLAKLEGRGRDLTILRILANAPHLFRPFVLLSDALLVRAQLPDDVREAVVLALAARAGTEYEWEEHVPMARRAGLTEAQVDAIADDPGGPSGLTVDQTFAVEVAHGLCAGRGIASDDWDRAGELWGVEGALDLVATVGFWGGFVPIMIEALGLRRPDTAPDA